jgi:hypothetical protein
MINEREILIGRFAWVMAWVGLVGGQLHALARHNTEEGQGDLDLPLTAAWSDPARKALAPLLDWANSDLVYLTYGKIWLPVFVAFTMAAFVVHRHRTPSGFEKWAWRIALTGYVWASAAVFGDYWLQWGAHPVERLLTITFVAGLPGLLLTTIGSSLLGFALLRGGYRPRLSAWLLALTFPLVFVIQLVTSMGSLALPVAFAFGLAGRRLGQSPDVVTESSTETAVPRDDART